MYILRNLRLGPRMGVGFGIVLCLMAAMIVLAVAGTGRIARANNELIGEDWPKAEAAATINALTRANARRTMELFFATDAAKYQQIRERIAENRKAIDGALRTLDRLVAAPQEKALLARIGPARAAFVASFTRVEELLRSGQRDEATRLLTSETVPLNDALQADVEALAALQSSRVHAAGGAIEHDLSATRSTLIASGLAALVVGSLLAWALARSVIGPIGAAVGVAQTVASGGLHLQIDTTHTDEPGELMRALKHMNDSLHGIVSRVRQSSESIATASSQIAVGNTDLSQRTEEQASSLQQTAASMEQLTGTVKNNADAARTAAQLVDAASGVADRGGRVVSDVVRTMEDINASSRRIEEIVGVIDGIAFQTNILALNASVEAARAGEQGKGFSVVAAEVRALAQRSAQAAREIKSLVTASVEKMADGSRLADDAGRTMREVVLQVRHVTELVNGISLASHEQATGIHQVGAAVSQLDQVTQQNAALVEQSAAAAESLAEHAQHLVRAVGVFRLGAAAA